MSMALCRVEVSQLREELTAVELAAIPGLCPGNEGNVEADTWLEHKLLQACDRVVAAVNSCRSNSGIKTGLCKVPKECVRTALVLARHAVISALPGLSETLEGSSRSAEYQTAVKELSELASCTFKPEYSLAEGEGVEGTNGISLLRKPADTFMW